MQPDYRYRAVKKAVDEGSAAPSDPVLAALFAVMSNEPCPIEEVEYAYDLYMRSAHRVVVDAFLLAKTEHQVTAKVLGIPEPVLATYALLFCDTTTFRNKLEVLTYAAEYPVADDYGKELVKTAVTVGPEYLVWCYGSHHSDIDTRYVVRRTMVDAFFRSMAHKGNKLTSAVAREAQKWMQTAIRNAEILERLDPSTNKAAFEELRLALTPKDSTYTVETAPVKVTEILH